MARADVYDIERWRVLARESAYNAKKLSAMLHVSPRQLRRYANEVLGHSPQEWLNELRLANAISMLGKKYPVKVIAPYLGFKQVSHFSRTFKIRFGLSPRAFLAQNGSQTELPR